jgi:DNA-directed RNA polymerase specialized sigma24 family protein
MTVADRVAANVSLARHMCRRFVRQVREWDFDTYLSAALEGLWRAARKFEPDRGLKFSTLAGLTMWRQMSHLYQFHHSRGRSRHKTNFNFLELDESLVTVDPDTSLDEFAAWLYARLTPEGRFIAYAVAAGDTYKDLSPVFGCSDSAVGARVAWQAKKTRAYLEKLGLSFDDVLRHPAPRAAGWSGPSPADGESPAWDNAIRAWEDTDV